eukprot:4299771-Amphidinium_carterae.1
MTIQALRAKVRQEEERVAQHLMIKEELTYHLQYRIYSSTETESTSWRLKHEKKKTGWKDYVH